MSPRISVLLLLASCSAPLPELLAVEDLERQPGSITLDRLVVSEGIAVLGDEVAFDALVAGTAYRATWTVRDLKDEALEGVELAISATAEGFQELVGFPTGARCSSDAAGHCETILLARGGVGWVQLSATAAGTSLSAQWDLVIGAKRAAPRVQISVEGVGDVDWEPGQQDPLALMAPMTLSGDQPQPGRLSIRLEDGFGNPLPEVQVRAYARQMAPGPDGGQAPSDGGLDASAPDGSALEAGVLDAAPDGGGALLPSSANAPTVLLAASPGDCSSTEIPDRPGEGLTDEQGALSFCLQPGVERGDWMLYLAPEGLIDGPFDHGEPAFQLHGQTVAGLPNAILALVDREPLLCQPGRYTDPLRFRVVNAQGEGVPQVRVGFESLGELDGVSPSLAITNSEGDVTVRGACPARLLQQDSAIRAVVEREIGGDLSEQVAVEVRADAVSRIEISPDAGNPAVVHTGDLLRFVVTAYDPSDVPVVHPLGSDEPLALRLGIASAGHGGSLLLPGDEPVLAQQLAVDGNGQLALELTVNSRATLATAIVLAIGTLDGQVESRQAIVVSAGAPQVLISDPSQRVQALVGAGAGSLTVRVLDGENPVTANGVPGVRVDLTAPVDLTLDRLSGLTDAHGRFTSTVTLVDRVGDHSLSIAARLGEWTAESSLIVEGTTGLPQRLAVELAEQALPLTGQEGEEPAHELTLRAGTSLAETLTLRLENEHGGGIPELGLAIALLEGAEADCATWEAPGSTDGAGEIHYGGQQGQGQLSAGPRLARCLYRLSHGNSPATALLRVIQTPGLPVSASLERVGGLLPPITNRSQGPAQWTEETASQIQLSAQDANANPVSGLRMWLEVSNCWISGRTFNLDAQGEALIYATPGSNPEAPCSLTARYRDEVEAYSPPQLDLASDGYAAPQLFALDQSEAHNAEWSGGKRGFLMDPGSMQTWRLDAANCSANPLLPNGAECDDFSICTSAQVVELGAANEQGVRPVLRVLRDGLPLHFYEDQEDGYFTVDVKHRWLGPGRWLGLRLVAPRVEGEALALSAAVAFYAQPPFWWVGAGAEGSGKETHIVPPQEGQHQNGNVNIIGGHRVNLDEDPALELLVCGADRRGRVFAVLQPNPDGSLPEGPIEAQRSSLYGGDGNEGLALPFRPEGACRLADLNADGHLDLVVPGRLDQGALSAGYPNVAIHHGAGDGSFGPGHRVVWVDRSLRNQQIYALELSLEPPAVIICSQASEAKLGYPCLRRFRLPLDREGAGWLSPVLSFDRLEADDPERSLVHLPKAGLVKTTAGPAVNWSGKLVRAQISGALPGPILEHPAAITALAYRSDLNRLVTGSVTAGSMLVRNWDLETRTQVWEGQRFQAGIPMGYHALAISPDGQSLAKGETGGVVQLVSLASNEQLRDLWGHRNTIYSLAFRPDGERLASGSADGTARIWNVETGELLHTLVHEGHFNYVRDLAFSPDGQHVATVSHDAVARIWSVESGQLLQSLVGHVSHEDLRTLAYSPDGRRLATGGEDNTVRIWDLQSQRRLMTLDLQTARDVTSLTFTGNGRYLIAASAQDGVQFWSMATGTLLTDYEVDSNVQKIAISQDGTVLATAGLDRQARLWPLWWDATHEGPGVLNQGWGAPLGGQDGEGQRWDEIATFSGHWVRLQRPYSWRPGCGNGVLDPGELFDTGEQVWEENEFVASCGATCGDGRLQSGEACDDGNEVEDDGCLSSCQAPRCGDGLTRQDLAPGEAGYEACDDGNDEPGDGCGSDCNRCGDGVLGADESCDDGNEVDDDGCSNCILDSCGNGQVDAGEDCDIAAEGLCRPNCRRRSLCPPGLTGTVTITPDQGPLEVYCDDGWTLIAMVHPADQHGVDEPRDWFSAGNEPEPLAANELIRNHPPSARPASTWLAALAGRTGQARFDFFHRQTLEVRARYYKTPGGEDAFGTWFELETEPTLTCRDRSMRLGCGLGTIGGPNPINFERMQRPEAIDPDFHMRLNPEQNSGVYTRDWERGYEGYWGHGLRIWLRP